VNDKGEMEAMRLADGLCSLSLERGDKGVEQNVANPFVREQSSKVVADRVGGLWGANESVSSLCLLDLPPATTAHLVGAHRVVLEKRVRQLFVSSRGQLGSDMTGLKAGKHSPVDLAELS